MNKNLLFAIIILCSIKVSSQTFTYRTGLKDMCGIPGDIFSCSISFTNTASTPINIFINRYQKTMPPYWNSCYCYQQCHSPLRDTITLNIPAFSTDVIYVQFKTDSVNPGSSISDFSINQIGFESNSDSIQLTASTACNLTTGITDIKEINTIKIFPNPATDVLTVSIPNETINKIKVYTAVGQLKENIELKRAGSQILNISNYSKGIYIIEVYSDSSVYRGRFLKE